METENDSTNYVDNFFGRMVENIVKRGEQIILTRLRIGHSRIPHGHLMEKTKKRENSVTNVKYASQ